MIGAVLGPDAVKVFEHLQKELPEWVAKFQAMDARLERIEIQLNRMEHYFNEDSLP